ncbi:MAG: S41 family peptidase [Gemmatimonadota bacterium]
MRSKGVVAAAVLTCALVSGGWLMERSWTGSHDLATRTHLFDEVLEHVKRDFVDTIPDSLLYRHAIDGALRELHDPHTTFLNPRRLSRLEESTTGHYAGVGIQMDLRDSGITVAATLPGSPAEQVGILTGDRIDSIASKSARGLTSEEALKVLRGPAGTEVKVVVERPGVAELLTFTLVRREIQVNPVRHALLLPDGIGYVELTVFSESAATVLSTAIDSLRAAGARSLVLDLRGDPGGLLSQGVDVADLFLDAGQMIVSTKGRMPTESLTIPDRAPQRWVNMPMVVLTDSNSASASEIVAGALQDHDRALIVGTATYGKGSAQRVFKVDQNALKLTTALWYTPSGRSINRPRRSPSDDDDDGGPPRTDSVPRPKFRTDGGRLVLGGGGIVPDVEVSRSPVAKEDKALQVALGAKIPAFRDAMFEYALALKTSRSVTDPTFQVSPAMRDELWRRMRVRGIDIPRAVYDSAGLVDRALGGQIARYVFGTRTEFERELRRDPVMTRAELLLRGATTPKVLLSHAPSPK